MVRTNLQEFVGDVHVLSNLQVGSNLFANDLAANVLTVIGSIGANIFIGDGGLLSNIATTLDDIVANPGGNVVSNTLIFESGQDATSNTGLVTRANVGISISNTEPSGEFQFAVGSNIFVNTHASNVLTVVGRVGADYFVGDGGLLSNIATTLDAIIDQGNTVSNTIQLISGVDATSNTGLVTHKDVGISISNTEPTGEFQFGVGSNLLVNVYSSNVLAIEGNVSAEKMTLGTITVTSAYGLNHVTAQGSVTGDTISLTNATTGLAVTSNATVGGNVTAETVITSANVEVGDRLKFASNVFVDDLRVADLAANLVTYDKTTGELMDSGGLFANKIAVVSVQPPSALSANTTTIAKHGTYTVTTSGLESTSNAWNAFDGDSAVEWKSIFVGGRLYDAGGLYTGPTRLATTTKQGEWLAIEFPYKTTLRHMKLTPPAEKTQYPASANVYATNDSLTWTELVNWSGVDPGDQQSNVQTIIVNATESFKKYAMVVTKTNEGTDNTALAEWKLFTESFSIDGGQISMAQQPVTGGETTMEQSGPHSRGAAVLKKYPEIAFDASKADTFANSNAYTQAGYEISSTSRFSTSYDVLSAFNGTHLNDHFASKSGSFSITSPYNYTLFTNNVTDKDSTQYTGEEIKVKMPHKIKLSKVQIISYVGASGRKVASGHIFGSNTGANGSWTKLTDFSGLNTGTSGHETVSVSTTDYYEWYSLVVTNLNGSEGLLNIYELEYYGYEEGAGSQGDTSVDTTFTSIMNTPQTTGANVYVDGNLGETFTNRVTGPTVSNTHTTYMSAEKYWELSGNVESNVTIEANTFLSGDQPHSVSVWFNSSNLEANTANTCVFSISDQEKLDSMNLDLQSNTWHNLTYAYQGEGGSRVTYLDGRKVAEDQAEDTFGDYPPFAMTGYSQGGYVVSTSTEYDEGAGGLQLLSWMAFDNTTGTRWDTANDANYNSSGVHDNSVTTIVDGTSRSGDWIQVEFPHKLRPSYFTLNTSIGTGGSYNYQERAPKTVLLAGSNNGTDWVSLFNNTSTPRASTPSTTLVEAFTLSTTQSYKYFRLIVLTTFGGESGASASISELQFYGHRENDLVRLPDPTNVLKYPHVALSGPAQRGYVVSASTTAVYDTDLQPKNAFNGIISPSSATTAWQSLEDGYNGTGTYDYKASSPHTSNLSTSTTQYDGEWLSLETPNKIRVQSYKLYVNSDVSTYRPDSIVLLGSDTVTNGSWNLLHTETSATYTNNIYTGIVNSNTPYKYHRLLFRSLSGNGGEAYVNELEFFGTEENSSVPIQIGGGNIDKVANFRVYDKFIDQNQALEIWDAQKDEFGRAKSSMTLQKGRLGIGTTEPEGRLAVLDEPNTFEPRWPPKPLVGYNTHIEGYGEFVVHRSGDESGGEYRGNSWWIFDDNQNVFNYTYHGERDVNDPINSNYSYFKGTNGEYTGGKSLGGISGDWTVLESPKPIKINDIIRMRCRSAGQSTKGFIIAATNKFDGGWTKLTEQSNLVWQTGGLTESKTFHFENDTYYKYYAIIITQAPAQYGYPTLSNMEFSGIVQQGQSVLHDGQLTLTKSLNVPRIGPALDADDTPRRDRLIVEYNTSTNPTFEGAVRDTSGRGNDGVFVNQTHYDATERALVFDGVDDRILTRLQNPAGESLFSGSLWFKTNTATEQGLVWIGSEGAGKAFAFKYNGYAATPNLEFSFYGNDCIYNYTLTFNTCYHIAFAYSGGTASSAKRVWVNGTEVALTSQSSTSALNLDANAQLMIGDRPSNGADLNGTLSNFKLYDCALTAEEVKTLYDMGRNGSVANPQPLHIAAPLYAPGTIVQVEQAVKTDTQTTTSASPVDVSGLSVTIHPKFSNSKILVSYQVNMGGNYHMFLRVFRTQNGVTTIVGSGDAAGTRPLASSHQSHLNVNDQRSMNMEILEPCNGTDAIEYKVQFWVASTGGDYTAHINRAMSAGDNAYNAFVSSSITAKEVCQ